MAALARVRGGLEGKRGYMETQLEQVRPLLLTPSHPFPPSAPPHPLPGFLPLLFLLLPLLPPQYQQYVTHCLANLNKAGGAKGKRVNFFLSSPSSLSSLSSLTSLSSPQVHFSTLEEEGRGRKVRSRAAVRYAATRLQERGVLQSIGELPDNQLKNVQFTFLPLEQVGLSNFSPFYSLVSLSSLAKTNLVVCMFLSLAPRRVCSRCRRSSWG